MNKKELSSYDEFVESLTKKERENFEKEYKEFLLSELLIAIMRDNEVSVRKLAKEAGISPTVVQELRSGKKKNITLHSFVSILNTLGYSLIVERPAKRGIKKTRMVMHNSKSLSNQLDQKNR